MQAKRNTTNWANGSGERDHVCFQDQPSGNGRHLDRFHFACDRLGALLDVPEVVGDLIIAKDQASNFESPKSAEVGRQA